MALSLQFEQFALTKRWQATALQGGRVILRRHE
jgi:hypothetical protein